MIYDDLLYELKSFTDEKYAEFNWRIVNDKKLKCIGVRTAILRKLAKKYKGEEIIFSFPNEYYEVVFLKLAVASTFSYEKLTARLDDLLPLITDWALCDSAFKPKCINKNKDNFVIYIKKYISADSEFTQRFALITLLLYYVEERWLGLIKDCVERCDTSKYYVMMGAAWLIAEVLVKYYESGVDILTTARIDKKTKNKAIQKACESYRISPEQKQFLKTLKA